MDCVICLEKIKKPLFLTCAHGFCLDCIVILIQKRYRKCPVCRTRITWTIPTVKNRYGI